MLLPILMPLPYALPSAAGLPGPYLEESTWWTRAHWCSSAPRVT